MTGYVVCRPSPSSPSNLSFLKEATTLDHDQIDINQLPSTGWLPGDAHVFTSYEAADAEVRKLHRIGIGRSGWFVLPQIGAGR